MHNILQKEKINFILKLNTGNWLRVPYGNFHLWVKQEENDQIYLPIKETKQNKTKN